MSVGAERTGLCISGLWFFADAVALATPGRVDVCYADCTLSLDSELVQLHVSIFCAPLSTP